MKKPIISREESARLESAVRELILRSAAGEDCDSLYTYVRKRTEVLFYEIPKNLYYLKAEDCAEFLLSQKDNIDNIIYSYRIVRGCKYVTYIKNAVKLRTLIFTKRKREKEMLDYSVNWSCLREPQPYSSISVSESEPAYNTTEKHERNFKGLFNKIITLPPAESPDPVKLYLSSNANRRDMLLYIISEQDDLSLSEQKELASIFNAPLELMATLSFCMHVFKDEKREERESKREQLIARSWVRYLAITNAIETEEDPRKRSLLQEQQEKVLIRLRSRQEEYQNKKRGMTYREIARHLDVSIGTVVSGVRRTRRFLSSLSGDDDEA